jgi:hypothetical protein
MKCVVIVTCARSARQKSAFVAQLLDAREDVIPAAAVESRRVVAKLMQDLVHLERREQRLDQHGRADRAAWNAELVLREHEDVVPQPRFEMALELRQVEVRAAAARDQLLRIVEEVEREIEDGPGDGLSVDQHVLFGEMPAARPHEQHRGLVVEAVRLAFRGRVVDPAADRIAQIELSLQMVVPLRRVGVLEVGHEHIGARVECVDDHLAIHRTGDLDAAVDNVGRDRRACPIGFADRARLRQEVGQRARIELRLASGASSEQLRATPAECPLQLGSQRHRLGGQNFGVFRRDAADHVDAGAIRKSAHVHEDSRIAT